jgi:flagellar motility protein MotE (MotC chaperone)
LVEAIDEGLALQIISGMKSKIAGQVLSNLDVKVAKRISENLAGKRDKPSEKTNSPGN